LKLKRSTRAYKQPSDNATLPRDTQTKVRPDEQAYGISEGCSSVVRHAVILVALTAGACAQPGYMYDTGSFVQHPRPEFCASRGQMLDPNTLECVTPAAMQPAPLAAVSFSNEGETYAQDKIWNDRIEHGACTRLRDRRTDSPADIAECNRDYAMTPICISYKGFAFTWFDMANDPNPELNSPAVAMGALNALGTKGDPAEPSYDRSPQFREVLRRLLNVTYSPARAKWSTRDQFADYAYKICMEGHPF
jgi:hypothetical protein